MLLQSRVYIVSYILCHVHIYFIEEEASGLLSCLGIKRPLSQITLVGHLMPKMHSRQSRLTYNACGPLKTKKEYKNSKKQDIHDIFIKTN